MFLGLLFFANAAWAMPITFPIEIVAISTDIRNEKSRERRLELFTGLIADVKRRVNDVPENIPESEIPRVEALYELNILLGSLKPETLNPMSCPKILSAMVQMTNPNGIRDSELSPTGRLALDVVKSVCAP